MGTQDINDVLSERLLAEDNLQFESLMLTIKALLDSAWGQGWGTFVDDEPTQNDISNTNYPIIVYDYIEVVPSHVSPHAKLHSTGRDPNNEDQAVMLSRQWFDYTVRFDVWAANNRECRRLTDRFRAFMAVIMPYLKIQGITHIKFTKETYDIASTNWRDTGVTRQIHYYFRMEQITVYNKEVLSEIVARVLGKNEITTDHITEPNS